VEERRGVLRRAGELAHRQGALFFELRAMLDLTRLDLTDLDEGGETTGQLAAVVGRFPAAVGYAELNDARALLAQILSRA
jgi:predicted ATPase